MFNFIFQIMPSADMAHEPIPLSAGGEWTTATLWQSYVFLCVTNLPGGTMLQPVSSRQHWGHSSTCFLISWRLVVRARLGLPT